MYNAIVRLFKFLLPILRTEVLHAAATTLNKMADPTPRRRTSYSQRPRRYTDTVEKKRNPFLPGSVNYLRYQHDLPPVFTKKFHDVLMLAIDIKGPNLALVKTTIENLIPETGVTDDNGVYIDAWWIADDVAGTDDCDSAVFVARGKQVEARALLREHGLVE